MDRAHAKRSGPQPVPPVTLAGVRYEAVHWGKERGLAQNGGYVAAVDAKSGKELWHLRVYEIRYDPQLEADVQDRFITKLTLDRRHRRLTVASEDGGRFEIDLATKRVRRLEDPAPPPK